MTPEKAKERGHLAPRPVADQPAPLSVTSRPPLFAFSTPSSLPFSNSLSPTCSFFRRLSLSLTLETCVCAQKAATDRRASSWCSGSFPVTINPTMRGTPSTTQERPHASALSVAAAAAAASLLRAPLLSAFASMRWLPSLCGLFWGTRPGGRPPTHTSRHTRTKLGPKQGQRPAKRDRNGCDAAIGLPTQERSTSPLNTCRATMKLPRATETGGVSQNREREREEEEEEEDRLPAGRSKDLRSRGGPFNVRRHVQLLPFSATLGGALSVDLLLLQIPAKPQNDRDQRSRVPPPTLTTPPPPKPLPRRAKRLTTGQPRTGPPLTPLGPPHGARVWLGPSAASVCGLPGCGNVVRVRVT